MTDEITPAPIPEDVTEEMVEAFETLRLHRENDVDLDQAFGILDKAGFFAPIHEAIAHEDELHARTMAGLLGVDLNDRYPVGDENGIIGRAGEGPGFLGWRGPGN